MTRPARYLLLPDLQASCPFEDATNPHYDEVVPEAQDWIMSYNVFTDRKRAFFCLGMNELLVSHAYPYAGYEQFRTVCDFVNVLFVFDEYSDEQSGKDALSTGSIFLNAMTSSNWDDGSKFCDMVKTFKERFLRLAGPRTTKRFLKTWEKYCKAVVQEAELRERGEVLDVPSFVALRRENSAVRLCFGLVEYCFGTDIPDDVFEHPTFQEMYWAGVDHVCWANDIYSYDVEQSKGIDGNNIVTVLMKAKGLDVQGATDYAGAYCAELVHRFMDAQRRLPSWGASVDGQIANFIRGLGCWMKGNIVWSFATQRYFGPKHLEVKETRLVKLRPRECSHDAGDDSDCDSE